MINLKTMKKTLYIVVGLMITLVSCSKEIEIEQPLYESKVVVDGSISNDDYANIILTRSSPFLTEYDSASIRNTFLNYAKVTLYSSKGETEILTLFRRDEFFPPFVYRSVDIKGEVGVTYDLEIEVNDKIIRASTKIPKIPEVSKVEIIPVTDTTMNFKAFIKDDQELLNYYYTQIKIKNVDRNFHSSAFPLFNDYNNNGKVIETSIFRSEEPDPLNLNANDTTRNLPRYEFYRTDTVFLRFSAIDKNSYNVLYDIYLDQVNSANPFSFVNKNTSTNIIGGIGRWTGMGSIEYMLTE